MKNAWWRVWSETSTAILSTNLVGVPGDVENICQLLGTLAPLHSYLLEPGDIANIRKANGSILYNRQTNNAQPRSSSRGRVAAAAAWRDRTQTTTPSSSRARRRARRGFSS